MIKIIIIGLLLFLMSCASIDRHKANQPIYQREVDKINRDLGSSKQQGDLILKYDLADELDAVCPYSYEYLQRFNPNISASSYQKRMDNMQQKWHILLHKKDSVRELMAKHRVTDLQIFIKKIPMASKPKINIKSSYMNQLRVLDNFITKMPIIPPYHGYKVTSMFGMRVLGKKKSMHNGMDMVNTKFDEVYATASGKVTFSGKARGYGNVVYINHGNNITTRYAHLRNIFVKSGQKVEASQVIGEQGSTGRSSAKHLHYEIRINNKPTNPKKFLDITSHCLGLDV
jgi:murein DD-endopeptidase MepM/ murein hydrolase activator NlpD